MKIKIDPLDVLFSRFVRLRAGGVCEYCDKPKRLQCSHFHGRRKKSVRWDGDNAAGLCFSCHQYLGENPYVHTEWFKKHLGSEKFEALNIRANLPSYGIAKDKLEAELKDKIRLLEENNGN